MLELTWNRYGKSRIRLVKLNRTRDPHELVDFTIDIQLEGDFDGVYVDGDNAPCVATDTMKNTVYAFARRQSIAGAQTHRRCISSCPWRRMVRCRRRRTRHRSRPPAGCRS